MRRICTLNHMEEFPQELLHLVEGNACSPEELVALLHCLSDTSGIYGQECVKQHSDPDHDESWRCAFFGGHIQTRQMWQEAPCSDHRPCPVWPHRPCHLHILMSHCRVSAEMAAAPSEVLWHAEAPCRRPKGMARST